MRAEGCSGSKRGTTSAITTMESHRKGDLTEAVVITELKRRAIPVSIPFGDNERYDLVLESPEDELLRVQVKTGWLSDGTIEFHGKSQHTNSSGNVYKGYDGDVDYFLVYCYELDVLYLVGEEEFNSSMTLRVEEPKRENRRINWAVDFEFDARWPPHSGDDLAQERNATIEAVIDQLSAQNVPVARPVDEQRYRLVVRTSNRDWVSVRVKTGWLVDGRIEYNHESLPEDITYLAIYVHETETLYLVSRDEFDSSITLRVAEPERDYEHINWAADYEFPSNKP